MKFWVDSVGMSEVTNKQLKVELSVCKYIYTYINK